MTSQEASLITMKIEMEALSEVTAILVISTDTNLWISRRR